MIFGWTVAAGVVAGALIGLVIGYVWGGLVTESICLEAAEKYGSVWRGGDRPGAL